jgi:hypothetical protein
MLNREKHTYLILKDSDIKTGNFREMLRGLENDLIIDLSGIENVTSDAVDDFVYLVSPILDEWIVILVGDEDKLQEQGFLDEDIPSTPTYNEAMDYLYMMQLERELGEEE